MNFVTVDNGPIQLNVAVAGQGPLILCVHGFPELWDSWRHQIAHFSERGYKVAALDVRGYGGSSKPRGNSAHPLRKLANGTAAAIHQPVGGTSILFGHDWGAPIAWNTALLFPEKVTAVAGLSVPYIPHAAARDSTRSRCGGPGRSACRCTRSPRPAAGCGRSRRS